MSSGDFVCDQCSTIDNIHATQTTSAGYLCHQCLHGEWHNEFSQERFNPEEHFDLLNRTDGERPSFS
jgi:hypothetical protein